MAGPKGVEKHAQRGLLLLRKGGIRLNWFDLQCNCHGCTASEPEPCTGLRLVTEVEDENDGE